ncbi:DUF2254 domain-containing protein [Azospirillum sp. SYSU D00513]|uniref:DUF2254 domain-containing protein n=1 Tax=Azospirillum sp. SYSU D00513 TaxID=2812561 RepID=UPI001A974354|nr:DUF2254 domain-containing protein [Azospirillum sp. SYSU D00513]
MNLVRHYWRSVRASLWFVPVLMGAAAVLFAIAMLRWGLGLPDDETTFWLLYAGDTDNARELLSTLLSGMVTMFSLVVSITMVVLTLAAGQIGPRLIHTFIQDRQTQFVLGLFLADIMYLLVVFRTIDGERVDSVPHLAVTGGTVLTALCLFVLLFYIHKLARSIIYESVIRDVAAGLRRRSRHLLPEGKESPPPPALGDDCAWIALGTDGYVQDINFATLVSCARRAGAVIRVEVRPGHYLLRRGEHVAVHPARACNDELADGIRGAFLLGSERTPTQDLEFGIRQMVEMATRALSPGINDVFTAVAVIDSLSSSLGFIFERGLEPSALCDEEGEVRVVRAVSDHEGIVGVAFDQIRHAGRGNPAILIRLTDAIARLAPYATSDALRAPLVEQLDMVMADGEKTLATPRERTILRERHADARRRLSG